MNGDALAERAANRLEQRAARLAERNGVRAKVGAALEADADFLRRLKPSLVRARLHESAPATGNGRAQSPRERIEAARAEARELLGRMKPREMASRVTGLDDPEPPEPPRSGGGGAKQALLVVGASFAAGILLAKLLDWRGHAHPEA